MFFDLPVESMIRAGQQAYYRAIEQSSQLADSAPFAEFMLETIQATLDGVQTDQADDQASE